MIRLPYSLLPLWAVRDIIRRPMEGALVFSALFLLVLTTTTPLLFTQALSTTADRILDQAPDMVVRRVTPGGWAPTPVTDAVSAALSVPGITEAAPRFWGTASGPGGPVTVIGLDNRTRLRLEQVTSAPLPVDGQCIVGPDALKDGPRQWLLQNGNRSLSLTPIASLDRNTAIVTQDIVLTTVADARKLLGIPEGFCSDLAVEVFHPGEIEAVLPELGAGFPWPVKVSPRSEAKGSYAAGLSRPSAIWIISLTPAILAMALIVLVTVRERVSTQKEVGLLKAMGWTTGDIVSLHLFKGLFIALPAVGIGLLGACFLVFWPGIRWPGSLFFGWQDLAPALNLDAAGTGLTLLQVAGLVLCPYLWAVLWPAAAAAKGNSLDLLREGF